MSYQRNNELINGIGGNVQSYMADKEPCPCCDCIDSHLCINCDSRITQKECINNEGFCDFCNPKGDSDEK